MPRPRIRYFAIDAGTIAVRRSGSALLCHCHKEWVVVTVHYIVVIVARIIDPFIRDARSVIV
jgi:hypothetical protein